MSFDQFYTLLALSPLIPSSILAFIVIRGQRRKHGQVTRPTAIALVFAFILPLVLFSYGTYILASQNFGWTLSLIILPLMGIIVVGLMTVPTASYEIGRVVGVVIDDYKNGGDLLGAQSLCRILLVIGVVSTVIYFITPYDPRVEFYGQIIDQYGNPVPEVEVNTTIKNSFFGNRKFVDSTNKDGVFSLSSHKGYRGRMNYFEKQGYDFHVNEPTDFIRSLPFWDRNYFNIPSYFERPLESGRYNYRSIIWNKTTAKQPFIYHAWKKGEPAALIFDTERLNIIANTGFHNLELPATNGTVKIKFKADPKGKQHDPAEWSVEILVNDGGIIETDTPFLYEAPVSGYHSKWLFHCVDPKESCGKNLNRRFYFKARDGRTYGTLMIKFYPYYGHKNEENFLLKTAYWINPYSSRNLLYERSKKIRYESGRVYPWDNDQDQTRLNVR